MLANAAHAVIGNAYVKHAANAAGEDIDVVAACAHLRSLEYWVARSSRAMTTLFGAATERLLPRLQFARGGEQFRCLALDEAGHFHRRIALAEIEFLDPTGALFDLVGGDQDL